MPDGISALEKTRAGTEERVCWGWGLEGHVDPVTTEQTRWEQPLVVSWQKGMGRRGCNRDEVGRVGMEGGAVDEMGAFTLNKMGSYLRI